MDFDHEHMGTGNTKAASATWTRQRTDATKRGAARVGTAVLLDSVFRE